MILDIQTWWQSMDGFLRVFWIIAIVSSGFFVVQTIFTFAGGGDTDALGDADDFVEGDSGIGSQFFTIKNLIAFFTMFGWVGVAGTRSGWSKPVVIVAALLAGTAMVAIMIYLFSRVIKLQQSGTLVINNALNQLGSAYLPIPANRKGSGKVQLKVQGSIHELQAITDDEEDIQTGVLVKVNGIVGTDLLVVTSRISH